ncbi:MAG: ABC transporter permease [Treponema sp.]
MSSTAVLLRLVGTATGQTLTMVFLSTFFSLLLGAPLGVLLCVTAEGNLIPKPVLHQLISRLVNVLRSFPFIILMILLFPLSRIIIGTSIGTAATVVPLSIAAAPFVARVIESALLEVDRGVIQAALAMGSSTAEIIFKVLIPEALPPLVAGITLTIINLIGYSAMAGAIGGGGLGDLAIRYGYQRFRSDIMLAAVIVILVMVEVIQFIGTRISTALAKRR